ncbi:MAG: DUF748 domain-containing protein [Coleofasciculaceae cyanobacterium RL_1_1]|nr:DUF748 domain-containing protein [Coleofasciculaceae cyanobacterium RL_1_1]
MITRLWAWLLRPKVLLTLGGVSLVAIGVGYVTLIETAKRLVPLIAEREIEKILNRDINVGEFERLSLAGLRLSQTVIPIAAENQNSLVVDQIDVRYQPLGLLFSRLPIQIEISGTRIEIEQLEDGSWATINLDLPAPSDDKPIDLPFDPQVEVVLKEVNIAVLPLGARDPLVIDLDAKAQVRDNIKTAAYEVDLRVEDGAIALQGETKLETLESQVALAIQNLKLTDFNDFLPQDLISLDGGTVSVNLQIDQPAILDPNDEARGNEAMNKHGINEHATSDTVSSTNPALDFDRLATYIPTIRGTLALDAFQAKLAGIREPITAGGTLQFQGDRLRFDRMIAQAGAIGMKLAGSIDRRSGFDLRVTVPPVDVIEAIALVDDLASETAALASQVDLDVTAEVNVTGALDDPTLKLAARNVTPWRLDQLKINEVRTNLTVDRETLTLNGFRLTPAAGGRILARGNAQIDQLIATLINPPVTQQATTPMPGQPPSGLVAPEPQPEPQPETQSDTNPDSKLDTNPNSQTPAPINLPLDTVEITGNLDLDLPLDAIAAPYELPAEIALGRLRSVANVAGTLAEPTGLLNWELLELSVFGEAIAPRAGSALRA